MGKRREQRIEIHERVILRSGNNLRLTLCAACSPDDSVLLSPEQASNLTGIPTRSIYRLVESGTIHFREATNGKLTVCVKTLMAASSS